MSLTNYRDVGRGGTDSQAGFQFEFSCANCSRTWKSPFKPYRKGQFAGLIYKFAYFLGDRGSMSRATSALASAGANRARESALQEALETAEQRYSECPACRKIVGEECWDARARLCEPCATRGGSSSRAVTGGHADEGGNAADRSDGGPSIATAGAAALKCPNCSCAIGGGRFCEECGFDMASTHKSCPGCGTMCARATRFCAECGHAF